MHRVCVFCGSSPGRRPEYVAAARQLGQEIARRDLGLVFGGGHVGLMGVVADATLAGGAEVIGVIPQALQELEVGHTKLTQLHVVPNMHTRKAKMAELSDAFLVLPGGLGTLEETFEVWTWAQLGFHAKPLCLLDVAGFWQPLVAMVDRMVEEQFVGHDARQILHVGNDPATLLDLMARADSPRIAPVLREQDL